MAEAAGYLQRAGLGVRRTRAGQVTQLPTTGLVAGEFVHRTSRALDPHLHTHLVVANVARGVDGRWSTLDGRRMFSHAHATRAIYHARLRMELATVSVPRGTCPARGWGTSVGVDPTLRRLFSQRSAAMDEYLAGRVAKRNGPGRTRGAFHATRPDKDRTCTVDSLMGEWKQRAADYGFDLGDLTRVVGRGRSVEPAGIDPDRVRSGLEELSGRRRTLAHRDVVAVLAAASPQGTRSEVIESAATNVVRGRRCPAVPFGVLRSTGGPPIGDVRAALGHPRRGPGGGDSFRGAGGPGHRPGAVRAGPRHGRGTPARPGPRSVRRAAGSLTATDTAQRSMPDRSSPICRPGVGSGKASPRSGPARLRSVRHRVGQGSRA